MRTFKEILSEVSNTQPYSDEEVVLVDDHEEFVRAMRAANEKRDSDSLQLYILSPNEAKEILDQGGKLFMTKDGNAGAYVKADGYMGGLFKDPTVNRSKAAKVLQKARIQAGGYFFDAFATHLEDIYIKNGFRPVVRMDFNEAFAPDGWEKTNLASKPDNVFFVYDPTYNATVGEGERNNDYGEAYNFAKNFET